MTRNVHLLYLHNLLTDFRFQEAFIVIYFAQIVGSYTAAMAIVALSIITAALMDIPAGILSDQFGRKRTIVAGSICATLMMIFYAFSASALGLYVGAIFSGLSKALFNGNNNAFLYESLKADQKEDQFHHCQGRAGGMFQLGLGLSALIASFFASKGLQFIFILGIIPQVLATILSLMFEEPKVRVLTNQKSLTHLKVSFEKIRCNPRLRLLIIGQSISHGVGESSFSFTDAFINTLWPTWAVAFSRALNHGVGFVGFWFAGRIVDKIKGPYMLALAETYWFVVQTIATIMANAVSPVLFLSGAALFGPFIVARDQLLQKEFTDEQRATMGSVTSFTGSLVFAINAICLGVISDHLGLMAGVLFGVFACAFSVPIYVWLFRKHF